MSISSNQVNIWLFGNFTLDTKLFERQGETVTIKSYGGSVNFASQTLQTFFSEEHVVSRIFSIAIPSFLLNQDSILFDPRLNETKAKMRTNDQYFTHYVLDYRGSSRKLLLKHIPTESITFPGLVHSFYELPHIALITPIFNELSESIVVELKKTYPDIFIACDPQGWCRERHPATDEIVVKEWRPTESFLEAVSVIKLSIEDIKSNYTIDQLINFIRGIHYTKVILIITCGINGIISFFPGQNGHFIECYFIPVYSATEIIDTTGAGDVWLAAFSASYFLTKDKKKSLATATVISSLKVKAEGINFNLIKGKELDRIVLEHEQAISLMSLEDGVQKVFTK